MTDEKEPETVVKYLGEVLLNIDRLMTDPEYEKQEIKRAVQEIKRLRDEGRRERTRI